MPTEAEVTAFEVEALGVDFGLGTGVLMVLAVFDGILEEDFAENADDFERVCDLAATEE